MLHRRLLLPQLGLLVLLVLLVLLPLVQER